MNLLAVLYAAATSSSPFQLWQRENSSTTKVFGPPLKISRRWRSWQKKYYFSPWCLPRTWPVLEGVDATAKTRLHEPYNLLYQPLKIKLLKITVIMKTKVFINILSQIVCSCINLFAVLYAASSSSPFQLWQRENSSTTKVWKIGPPLKIIEDDAHEKKILFFSLVSAKDLPGQWMSCSFYFCRLRVTLPSLPSLPSFVLYHHRFQFE